MVYSNFPRYNQVNAPCICQTTYNASLVEGMQTTILSLPDLKAPSGVVHLEIFLPSKPGPNTPSLKPWQYLTDTKHNVDIELL